MSWTRIIVHVVFTTKNRFPFLSTPELRKKVFTHIRKNGISKGLLIDRINGYHDHVHCLLDLGREQTLSKVVQLIKGESSFWINKSLLTKQRFEWQDDYWAVSVGREQIEVLRKYIRNQEIHHRRRSFSEEFDELRREYGLGG